MWATKQSYHVKGKDSSRNIDVTMGHVDNPDDAKDYGETQSDQSDDQARDQAIDKEKKYCCYDLWQGKKPLHPAFINFTQVDVWFFFVSQFKETICFARMAGSLGESESSAYRKIGGWPIREPPPKQIIL